ncbi:MAG: TRASH domain-containing protein [Thermocladium sp.]|jgi:DNA-binding Lrp family transcriptional regulator|nr:MAG: hypothetical protein AT710_06475 [Thermocladium sp. ECH_B]
MDKLTETEYRILNELIQDSSEPITRLSRKLGLSRNTVSKTVRNLASRGVITRFTIEVGREYINDDVMAILITETKPTRLDLFSEIYESVDGRFIGIIKANNLAEIRKAIRESKVSIVQLFIVDKQLWSNRVINIRNPRLHCDYCGGLIRGSPIIERYHNRTYYFCCMNCLNDFRRSHRN